MEETENNFTPSEIEQFKGMLRRRQQRIAMGHGDAVKMDEAVGKAFQDTRKRLDLSLDGISQRLGEGGLSWTELIFFEKGLYPLEDMPSPVVAKLAVILPEFLASPIMGGKIVRDILRRGELNG